MPQKLTTTACFIQEESSGGKSKFTSIVQHKSSWMKQAVVVSF